MPAEDVPRDFLPLIADLYAAAVDETKWPVFAPRVAALFSAESCAIQARDPDAGVTLLSVTDNITPAAVHDYVAHYHKVDEWANRALLASNRAVLGQQLISSTELARSDFFAYQRMTEMFHVVGGALSVDDVFLGAIGVHRKSREFDEEDLRLMHLFLPHLDRALQIGRELTKHRLKGTLALEGLDRLAIAALLVDGDGRVLFANRAAVELFREGDGLRETGGRIGAGTIASTTLLNALIKRAARTGIGRGSHAGGQIQLARRDRRPLTALVSPLPPESLGLVRSNGLAMVLVRDPVQPALVNTVALQSLFGLTPAEARLAAALADGSSLEEFAERHGVSVQTVRTQLKHTMSKTFTSRQGELVALILHSTAALVR